MSITPPAIEFIDLAAQRNRLGSQIEAGIARVLAHGRFVLGPEVAELESRLAAWSGAGDCVTCANGTDALQLALKVLDIGPGDAVIVPAFSYVASAGAVANVGAVPVFADVDPVTFDLDPASAEAAISAAKKAGLKPRAIMPVDLFGQPADYDALTPLAQAYGLAILADAAQSFGAAYRGVRVGALADVTITSFYPSKPLGCYGDGGAIFVANEQAAARLRAMRSHGWIAGGMREIGCNSRLDTLQAAVLLAKLDAFEHEIVARNRAAERYAARLPNSIVAPQLRPGATSVWAQYTVKIETGRDAVAAACRAVGVPTAIHYSTPLHALPPYRHFPRAAERLTNAEALSERVISLPMHADLDTATQNYVLESLAAAVSQGARMPEPTSA